MHTKIKAMMKQEEDLEETTMTVKQEMDPINDGDVLDDQKKVKLEETAGISSSVTDMKRKKNGIDWDRIDQETAKSTNIARARRKRQLDDAIDGILPDPNADGIDDSDYPPDDEQYWKERSKRLAKAQLRVTSVSTNIGVRKVLELREVTLDRETQHLLRHFIPFKSQKVAIEALESILSAIEKKSKTAPRARKRSATKSKDLILVDAIRASIASNLLPKFLMGGTIVKWSVKNHAQVPLEIQSWVCRVICSNACELQMAVGSRRNLIDIMRSRITEICSSDGENLNEHSNVHSGGKGYIRVEHFVPMMAYIFGLRMVQPNMFEPENDGVTIMTCGGDRLQFALDIWCAAFENEAVGSSAQDVSQDSPGDSDAAFYNSATTILGALVRASVDPSFHTGRWYVFVVACLSVCLMSHGVAWLILFLLSNVDLFLFLYCLIYSLEGRLNHCSSSL